MTRVDAAGDSSLASRVNALFGEHVLAGQLLENLNIWLNVHDANLNMLLWNRVAERLSGYPKEDVLGHARVWSWCYPDPDTRQAVADKAHDIVGEGATVANFRNEIVCRDGSRRSMSWNSHSWAGPGGQIECAIVAGYDVTEMEGLRAQAEQLAVLEERSRLARDLHDSVTQSLYSLTLFAEAGRRLLGQDDHARAADYLDRLAETAHHTLREMRLLVYELRPEELEREGLLGALERRLRSVERRSGVAFELCADPDLTLPGAIETTFYRVAQEALNNALKHSRASHVRVRVDENGAHANLTIEDDGAGFDPELSGRGGLGMVGMRERVEQLGGQLTVRSTTGTGTRVAVSVPRKQRSDAGRE